MSSAAFAMALGFLKGIPRAIESPGDPPLLSSRRTVVIWYEGTSHSLVSEPAQYESAPAALDTDS